MCLAIPMQVISKKNNSGVAEIDGVKWEINFILLPDVNVGEYVIVHAGYAIQKFNEKEAQDRLDLFREMAKQENEIN